jgi:hypothetical protein
MPGSGAGQRLCFSLLKHSLTALYHTDQKKRSVVSRQWSGKTDKKQALKRRGKPGSPMN